MSFTFGGTGGAGDKKPTSFGFGNTSTPAANPPANLFGGQSSTTPAGPPPSGQSFGFGTSGGGSLFGGGAAAAAKSEATPGFGVPASTSSNQGSNAFSFTGTGGGSTLSQGQAAPNTTASASPFSFGNTTASTTPAQPPATAPAAGGFSFGGPKVEQKTDKPATASGFTFDTKTDTATGKPAAPGGFSFGGGQTSTPTSTSIAAPVTSAPSLGGADPNDSTSGKSAAPSFSFGNSKPDTSAANSTPAGGMSFGGLKASEPAQQSSTPAGGFSFGSTKPAEVGTTTAQKPAGGFSFGGTKPAEASATTAQKPAGGFSFGGTKPAEASAITAQKPAGGLSFGTPAADTTKTSSDAGLSGTKNDAAPASSGTFSFGAAKTESKPDGNQAKAATTTPGGFSFGGSSATTATKDSSTTQGKTTQDANLSASTTGQSTNSLQNKTMEDIINKWSSDLDKYSQQFQKQARQISTWDQALLASGDQISQLYAATAEAEQSSGKVDQALNYIENQQDELSQLLDIYEGQVKDITTEAGVNQPADQERENAYSQAVTLKADLTDMEKNLASLIAELNKSSEVINRLKEDDPVASIIKILNSQVQTLQWIDKNEQKVRDKLEQLSTLQHSEASPRTPTGKFKFGSLRLT